jgi:hypothetical protein
VKYVEPGAYQPTSAECLDQLVPSITPERGTLTMYPSAPTASMIGRLTRPSAPRGNEQHGNHWASSSALSRRGQGA